METANNNTQGQPRVAAMIQSGRDQSQARDCGHGIYENRGIGNSYLITTSAASVLVNAGALKDARRGQKLFAQITDQPIDSIVLTQSHPNQFGGLEVFKTSANTVIAHRLYPQDREYSNALLDHYKRGSRRIFGEMTGAVGDIMPTRDVPPDLLIDEFHSFKLGGRRFEIHWTPGGETRSAVIVWLPDDKVAVVGNLFGPLFGNHPNLNTLRGDKPRSALEFIDSVKKLRALAPEQILTGHEDIRGGDHIQAELTRIIDAVQWVHDQTVKGMNAGTELSVLMHEIKTPPELTLTEEYGRVPWNVRAIWHEYSGWFDPAKGTTELYGVPVSSVSSAVIELAGGVQPIIKRAQMFLDEGSALQALHLLNMVLSHAPDSVPAKQIKVQALQLLLDEEGGRNLWLTKWLSAEIREVNL